MQDFHQDMAAFYRPLPYPGLPTELVVSRVRDQVVAQPKPQP